MICFFLPIESLLFDSLPLGQFFVVWWVRYLSFSGSIRMSLDKQVPGVNVCSIWELIDQDKNFVYPDYTGLKVTVQDCWRTKERRGEQDAVRSILKKMNVEFVEAEQHHDKTEFCGSTLYRPQPNKNPHFAPKHYIDGAKGKFLPHTEEEQVEIMRRYCAHFSTPVVVCYCHYCLEGLLQGGVDGRHLADLVFP